ncbi:MAG: nicotinamide mononucleotide transporter [Balneolaceae bacterium]|nr:nicotinamide mononucleotide transporter [Balneolaceae bacterium]
MDYIIDGIITGVAQTGGLEWIAVIAGLMSVWFSMKENILVYPTGIVSVVIYVYLAFQYQLYADMGVNAYYFVMSVYGWYHWKDTDGAREQIPVTINDLRENLISVAILLGSYGILAFVLLNLTDSDVPLWDATTTAFAILGMWLMARKKLENWVAWIITDLISVPLYFYKGLVLTSFQFFIFTIMAVAGLIAWWKSYKLAEKEIVSKL